jgi:hypothetical protein
MVSNLLDGVYLFDGLIPDPDQVLKNFNSASAEDKKRFFVELQDSGLLGNPMIRNAIEKYERDMALYS